MKVYVQADALGGLLSANVSNAVYWVTEASGGLSMCEEKQDRLVFFYSLQKDVEVSLIAYVFLLLVQVTYNHIQVLVEVLDICVVVYSSFSKW